MDSIRVSGWGCVAFALMLLVLPQPWVAAAVSAAAVHELCHYLAIAALDGQVGRIAVGPGGAAMELDALNPVRELLAAATGGWNGKTMRSKVFAVCKGEHFYG